MDCSKCAAANPAGAGFCMKCGNPLARACSSCGTALPAEADFCPKCGAKSAIAARAGGATMATQLDQYIPPELLAKLRSARSGAGMEGERRVVTMLFCDVKGSTSAAEKLDPEEWTEIMNGAFKHLIGPVYRYEGTLARLMGDAVLAFFGAPIAHEDDPIRAVMAALEMIEGIKPYRAEVKRKWGIDFDVRAGINTGLVVVGEVGSDLRVEYTAMGDAVNLASRMESTAQPGTVQVAEATHRLVAPFVESEPLGKIEVKGKSATVAAFLVKGLKERPGSLRGIVGVESPMVGREKELQALKDATEELRRGRGAVVSLIAEAGLGKSRLAAEWRRWLKDTNEAAALAGKPSAVWLCEGRSLSFESALPYAPFISSFTACTGIGRGMDDDAKYRAILAHIAEAAPDALPAAPFIAALLGVRPSGEEAERVQYLPPPQLRAEVFRAVVRYYESLAARTPVVLLIDDLHWTDPTSLELLKELLALSDRATFLMLTLFRPSHQEPSWAFHETAARDFPHRYVSLQMLPLAESDSRQLVANLLHVEGLPESVRNLILAKSEGNPFFVEEVIRSLIDSGVVTRDADRWVATREVERFTVPDTLSALLTTRLDRLDEPSRRLAQTAAVIGREFDEASLRAVLPEGVDLDRALGELQRRGLVREKGRNPARLFAFKHVLVQDAAYNSILLRSRRGIHLQVAEALLAGPAPDPDSVSRHFLAADERVRAIPYLVAAAKHDARTASVAEAVTKYEKAISIVQESPDKSQARAAFEGLFDLYKFTGNVEKASAMTERMLQFAESVGDATMKVSAMNKSGFVLAMFRGALDAADEVLARSETLARKERDLAGLAEMNTIHCYIQVSQGKLDKAEGHLREAAEIGKKLGAEEVHLFGLTHSANCMVY
ncbi:MAG TPA: adenylate/guanylate cyclase domain-containing protein, partial [Thermoplasmata archaeon]|nr:adenylate/guanylate cyclase domain-containing protein [Thermoplasmata archaeon]